MASDKIDRKQVRHIAHLARLRLSDEECAVLGRQLSSILEYVEKLNELNTDGVEPTAQAVDCRNVFGEDEPIEPMGADRVLANAPDKDGPFFKVPKVLDQDSA
ncbi:MAG: Asp-tRNA(Asn)/Glu-tRNA(Gln) amidotransferase subunit GatC [Planctomycetota bacterium]|nr:Asp-tRNA(Asn)/Glu-tRNA(Gln) amidotransferase subunit GatC [Planctomycetota bacterium]